MHHRRVTKYVLLVFMFMFPARRAFAQNDSASLGKLRKQSGVDPTIVQSRAAYTFLLFDQGGAAGQVINRAALTLGVNRWSLAMKYEVVSLSTGVPGEGFESAAGDIRFSVLNAFYVKGKHALAASAEFIMPTGKPRFGSRYVSLTPSLTYSYTINPALFFAVQPQYSFDLLKDPAYPDLSVITIRAFLAKFTTSGYFFVFELRPVVDLANDQTDLIISPIVGKALGAGFNLIGLVEYPLSASTRANRGVMYQLGFNKNF